MQRFLHHWKQGLFSHQTRPGGKGVYNIYSRQIALKGYLLKKLIHSPIDMYKDIRKYIQQSFNTSLDTTLLSGPKYIKLLVRLLQHIGLPFWAQVFNDTLCDIDNLTSYINGDHKSNLFTNPKQFRSFIPRKEEISARVPGYENLGQYSQIEEI